MGIFSKLLLLFQSLTSAGKKVYRTEPTGKSLLWEVTGKRLLHRSYLLGTMHLMCAEDAKISANVKSILTEVRKLYFEIDLESASLVSTDLLSQVAEEGETLRDVLEPEEYERVKDFFNNVQPAVPFETLEQQYPLMIQSSLYELLLPCEQKNGIELKLMQEASYLKLPIKGLETVEFQMSVFETISYKEQAYELLKTIENLPKYQKSLHELIEVYKEQDIDKLYELTTNEESGIVNHLDLLLHDRNKKWVDQFETIANQESTLFAVGAGHLGGETGLIRLLKNKGYTLRPLAN